MALKDTIIGSMTGRVSPMVYTMMFVSIIIGFCFFTGFLLHPGQSILYDSESIIPVTIWGVTLFISALFAFTGLLTKTWGLVSIGSFVGFMMWLFASLNLLLGHNWYALITFGLFHLTFFTYVLLASSLGVIERKTIE